MVSLLWIAQGILAISATVEATAVGTLHPRAFAGQNLSWYAPGSPYNGKIITFVWPYGTVWVPQTPLNPAYTDSLFTETSDQQLVGHSKSLCLLDPGSSSSYYWVGDPSVFSDHPTCKSSNNWGTYRGAYLTLGGGYDMFCLFTNSQGDALVPGIPAYESGTSACENRGRVSIVGSSVQPAPATPIPPTSTVPGKGSSTTITSITAPPTTTSQTTTAKTTTMTTTTTTPAYPNPTITSLISTASSYLSKASSAAQSYSKNSTNALLASLAEQAIETAVTCKCIPDRSHVRQADYTIDLYDAKEAADESTATSVSSALDKAADQYFRAAALAIIAAAAPAAAAADAFFSAFAAIAPLFQQAANAGNDPKQNPSPSRTTTSRTTTTTTTTSTQYVCSICIRCADAALAEPSSTDALTKRANHELELTLESLHMLQLDGIKDKYKRSPTSRTKPQPKPTPTLSPNTTNDGDDGAAPWHIDATKSIKFCGTSVDAPTYRSYSGTGTNPYKPYYNYCENNMCASWQFNFLKASNPNSFLVRSGYTIPVSTKYATQYEAEHIYEAQAVPLFFKWAVENEPAFVSAYNANYDIKFCADLGKSIKENTQSFSTYSGYDYSTPPIKQLLNQLSSDARQPQEFVYLATSLNRIKGNVFGYKDLGTKTTYDDALARATHILMVAEYLNDADVVKIYQTVSRRVRCNIYQFGQAVMQSTKAPFNQFKNVNWLDLYDKWESAYISDIESQLNRNSFSNFVVAQTFARAQAQLPVLTRPERVDWSRLASYIQLNGQSVATISLSKLRRSASEQACPS